MAEVSVWEPSKRCRGDAAGEVHEDGYGAVHGKRSKNNSDGIELKTVRLVWGEIRVLSFWFRTGYLDIPSVLDVALLLQCCCRDWVMTYETQERICSDHQDPSACGARSVHHSGDQIRFITEKR